MLLPITPGIMGGKFTTLLFLATQDIGIQKKKKMVIAGWMDGWMEVVIQLINKKYVSI
jgi:hypothetical protein